MALQRSSSMLESKLGRLGITRRVRASWRTMSLSHPHPKLPPSTHPTISLRKALNHLHLASQIDDEGCQHAYWMGRVYLDKQDYDHAIPQFQQALECKELDHDKYAVEALEAIFRMLTKKHPRSAIAHSNLANVLVVSGFVRLRQAWPLSFFLSLTPPPPHPPHHAQNEDARQARRGAQLLPKGAVA